MATPTKRSPRVATSPAYRARARSSRRPQHRFNLKTKPYVLQPMMLAPVLPGETLKNLLLQSQVWSDPLHAGMKNVGWWCEYFFFYVKHRDLLGWEPEAPGLGNALIEMFTEAGNLDAYQDADGNPATYCAPGAVDFVLEAAKRVAEEFFRDEGETWDVSTIDGLPTVKIYGQGASDGWEKLTLESEYEDRRVDLDVDQDGKITVDEVNRAYVEWAAMRDAGLTDMDYDDWMRTYGTNPVVKDDDRVDHHRPEDLSHFREFTYPTNTVEPTTGVPATAVGWRVASRMQKSYAFREPGWIVGFTTVRPKVYMGMQLGALAGFMQSREDWLPAMLNDQLDVSHQFHDNGTGPAPNVVGGGTDGYWIDLRDLLNYGDQFVNYDPTGEVPFVSLPTSTGVRRYAAEAEIMSMFADNVNGRFTQDGVVSLSILGRQQEQYKNLVLGQA